MRQRSVDLLERHDGIGGHEDGIVFPPAGVLVHPRAVLALRGDETHREVLMLVGASGLSYEDAASVCGCQVGTIKSRVSRARRDLRERMEAAKRDAAAAAIPAQDA